MTQSRLRRSLGVPPRREEELKKAVAPPLPLSHRIVRIFMRTFWYSLLSIMILLLLRSIDLPFFERPPLLAEHASLYELVRHALRPIWTWESKVFCSLLTVFLLSGHKFVWGMRSKSDKKSVYAGLRETADVRETTANIKRDDFDYSDGRYLLRSSDQSLPTYSWGEITKHYSREDCWVVIHGLVFDVTAFVSRHPGGDIIYDGAGGDCTTMFESYHPLKVLRHSRALLEKYLVGRVKDYTEVYSFKGDFFTVLRQRVEAAIPQSRRRNSKELFVKAFLIISLYLGLYYVAIYHGKIWAAPFFGIILSQIGVNIMHDGNHAAFSSSKILCWFAGFTMDLVGSSSIVYRRSHDYGHHSCVNHLELDRAFDTMMPVFRLHEDQPKYWFHKYQHLYAIPMYSFTALAYLVSDFAEIDHMDNYPPRRAPVRRNDIWMLYATKTLFVTYAFLLPVYWHGWYGCALIAVYIAFASWGFALLFAVNHWTEKAMMVTDASLKTEHNRHWATLQVTNSSNFATNSWFWGMFSGGLNFQIEHHLFPGICHTRYPIIAPILRQTCKDFNIDYDKQCFDTFWEAIWSHLVYLRKLGQ